MQYYQETRCHSDTEDLLSQQLVDNVDTELIKEVLDSLIGERVFFSLRGVGPELLNKGIFDQINISWPLHRFILQVTRSMP